MSKVGHTGDGESTFSHEELLTRRRRRARPQAGVFAGDHGGDGERDVRLDGSGVGATVNATYDWKAVGPVSTTAAGDEDQQHRNRRRDMRTAF